MIETSLLYETKYFYSKSLYKGDKKKIIDDLSEIIGYPCDEHGQRCLLSNILLSINDGYKRIMISSDDRFYSRSFVRFDKLIKPSVTRRQAKKFIECLVKTGYAEHTKGCNTLKSISGMWKGGYLTFSDSLVTRVMELTSDKKNDVEKMKLDIIHDAEIVMKKFKNVKDKERQKVTFKMNEELKRMKNSIKNYNDFMAEQEVRLNGVKLDCATYRIFLDSEDCYGRFHSVYQTFSQAERSRILINGESVAEIDIVSSHPSILLTEAGYDPKEVSIYNFIKVNDKLTEVYGDTIPHLDRTTVKPFVLCAINCGSKEQAIKSLAAKPELKELYGSKHEIYELILDELEEWLDIISDKFYTNQGLRLMKKESDIVYLLIQMTTAFGIPLLFVHDSFICRLSDVPTVKVYLGAIFDQLFDGFQLRLDIKESQLKDL